MSSVPRPTLRAALDQQGGRCFYCGRPLRLIPLSTRCGPRDAATADHLVPIVCGGTEDLWNIVAACAPCNERKGFRYPTKDERYRKAELLLR